MIEQQQALTVAARELEVDQKDTNAAELRNRIIEKVRHLILYDMHRLNSILYRVDVDEKKLRMALDQNTEKDTAPLIADLIIERQVQKIISRSQHKKDGSANGGDEELW